MYFIFFFFQAEDGIRDIGVTGVQTCALPISDKVTPINILSKNLVTGKESSDFYYEGIEKDDKAFGYSSCYVPENVAPKVDSKSIIGSDDRFRVKNTTTFPYSAICYVEMTWPDGARSIGSA